MAVDVLNGYLTPSKAARVSGLATETLKLRANTGKLNALIIPGGRRLYRLEDMERIARERAQKGNDHA